ncbi:AAA family ATPase [Actinoplanes bogorensis]|uniref:AAA family ATPase n=1 Tax=Paractinoplanes bogorensis TaxID=1610840 RepID=A0ABS5Z754_9ACTN|nr:BTAD domain-containing putative transcriptional regulator [Actinoplanes bogorensis]MBU2670759.1 AAA family ATPase [Actinoplanes bogorensis]
MLELRLLGGFELLAAGTPVTLTSVRAQAVLAFLALRGGNAYGRKQLAFALWPDSAEHQARTNLRHVLHTLRAAVPGIDAHLRTDAQSVALTDVQVDIAGLSGTTVAQLTAAADSYRGDLLEGWYDDWVLAEREHFRRTILDVLVRLVPMLERDGDPAAAIRYAERHRALDRLAEEPYQALIHLYDRLGDRARAVRTYHECAATLRDELGVSPSEKTLSAYAALLPAAPEVPRESVFVGRRDERRTLIDLWKRDPAHLVVIGGEPGIGKSRLAAEFRHWAAGQGAVTASARSYPAEGELAYGPIVAWMRELGVGRPDPAASDDRLRLFEAMVHALRPGPGGSLLVADDLHAADPATCQFLHFLVRESPGPLLVVATARLAEMDPGHPAHVLLDGLRLLGRCTTVPLARLDRAATAALAERLGHRLVAADVERLFAETEGNPLFVVESLRAGSLATPRVQAVLEARLRQLSPEALELAGIAATAGSSIPVGVFPGDAAAGLDELWRRQILVTGAGDTYDFSHDKLRETAYGMLPPARRRQNHGMIARALSAAAGIPPALGVSSSATLSATDTISSVSGGILSARLSVADENAGRIAVHLVESGARAEAVGWFVRAARVAQRVYADAEAAALLLRAAELVRGQDRELDVLTSIPGPLSSAEGYASPRLREVLDRALALAGPEPAAPLLRAQAMAVLSRGEFHDALRFGAALRERGEQVEGHFVQGVGAAWRADHETAREHLAAAIAHYRPEDRGQHLLVFGQDPLALCHVRLAHVHIRLGRAEAMRPSHGDGSARDSGRSLDRDDEARRLRDRGVGLARSGGHPFTLGGTLLFAAVCDLDLGDWDALRDRAAELNGLRDKAAPIRLFSEALNGLLDGNALARIDTTLDDPGRFTAPGVPAMLLRLRLEAARSQGLADEERATARRLLADGVRVWDPEARAALSLD